MAYDNMSVARDMLRAEHYRYLQENAAKPKWTEERCKQLEALWADGKTAAECARILGCVSRNAVIGKVHRLGLAKRANDGSHTVRGAGANKRRGEFRERQRKGRIKKHRLDGHKELSAQERAYYAQKARLRCDALPPLTDETGARIGLMALQPHHCRFPIGDPKADDFGFCARPRAGGPYCPDHAALAFNGRALIETASGPAA